MARKNDPVEQQLQTLRAAAVEGPGLQLTDAVARALRSSSNVIVEQATLLVREHEIRGQEEQLLRAYRRFLRAPDETDKGCRAKLPIMEALSFLDYEGTDFFLEAMSYTQLEASWGDPVDTAANLRGAAAFGLIGCRLASPAATMVALTDLLADRDRLARGHAARAIGSMSHPATGPLLRFKVHTGDEDPEVIGECFRGLLMYDVSPSVPFVSEFLNADFDLAVEAATALGESRNALAAQALLSATNGCGAELLEAFYVSAGLSRVPEAITFLIDRIASNSQNGPLALKALAPNRFYPGITDQVAAAVQQVDNPLLNKMFRDLFET